MPVFKSHMTGVPFAPFKLSKMYTTGGSWSGSSLYKNLKFIGFDSATNDCGKK